MWDTIKDIWYEFERFLDRVVGWLNYVFGGADDPYIYTTFHENID